MEQYFDQLIKIYNTLLMVSTSGENTIIMGQCLGAMREMLETIQKDLSNTELKSAE